MAIDVYIIANNYTELLVSPIIFACSQSIEFCAGTIYCCFRINGYITLIIYYERFRSFNIPVEREGLGVGGYIEFLIPVSLSVILLAAVTIYKG